jgi:hypothetical protein
LAVRTRVFGAGGEAEGLRGRAAVMERGFDGLVDALPEVFEAL